jgi:hypothetical protein
VYIPEFAQHWAGNHDKISVAAVVMFHLRSVVDQAKIFRANRVLRKLGTNPTPPGVLPGRDWLKLAAANAYYAIPKALRTWRLADLDITAYLVKLSQLYRPHGNVLHG